MMRPIIHVVASPGGCALAILLIFAVEASAQERPVGTAAPGHAPAAAAGSWSGYRPGTAWARGTAAGSSAAPAASATTAPARGVPGHVAASRRGWAGYAPSSAWTGYRRGVTPSASAATGIRAGGYASRTGWATYAPSSSWSAYRPGAAWQSYAPPAARPVNMRQAHVPGPSPYADELARNYYEYGTGRPVPLAKPWLPGSP